MTQTEMTIERGGFGFWHEQKRPMLGRILTDNLRSTLSMLRSEGVATVHIKRGGSQRPRYETRTL